MLKVKDLLYWSILSIKLEFTVCLSSSLIPKVTVTQTYKNEESATIEAIYKFPIHEAAAICGFEAEIDGNRTVKGIVKEAQQAAKEYDEAIQVCINRQLADYQVVLVR